MPVTARLPGRRPGSRPCGEDRGGRLDAATAVGAVALVVLAAVVGAVLLSAGVTVLADAPPLFARWGPHAGPGSPAAVLTALLVTAYGPAVATRLPWRPLLVTAYGAALVWTTSLALVDGWDPGIAGRLTTSSEYLSEVPPASPVGALLDGFAGRIVGGDPDSWATHVAGHPPGALLFFVGLHEAGLRGGGWAGIACIAVGCSAGIAIAVTLRGLADEMLARRLLPFLVLTPAAIWVGVSADAVFLGVSSWGVALLGLAGAARGRRAVVAAALGGLLLGASLYLSYGLVLLAPIAAAVVVVRRRVLAPAVASVAALGVVAAVTAGGFSWWEGYRLVVERYYQGYGMSRPYSYWVWANVAALVVAAGPAVAGGLRRLRWAAMPTALRRRGTPEAPATMAIVVTGAAVAVTLATLSGLSKGEVERIWLPFTAWLTVACAAIPRAHHRRWLAVQAGTALATQHLLFIRW